VGQLPPDEYEKKEAEGCFAGGLIDVIGPARYRSLERSNYFAEQLFGRAGVERAMDDAMRPSPGARLVVATRDGEETLGRIYARPGRDIALTIDIRLQQTAEETLGESTGAVIVMDVNSGEILALASSPRYDLNTFRKRANYGRLLADPGHPLVHRALAGLYAPGSTFKILEATAAVHEIENFDTVTYECHHRIRLGPNAVFRCNNHASTGPMDLHDALKKSCNIFFYRTASRLGGAKLKLWSERFGIGRHTGIEIGDAKGNLVQPRTEGQIANMAIGQGPLLVTPLQLARVVAAVANGGRLVTPHVVLDLAANLEPVDLGLRDDRLALVRRGMWAVVNERGGTAYRHVRMEHVEVAGKTGTAETADSNLNNAWFVGFAPFDRPRICVAVVIEKTAGHGGNTAGPIAKKVLQAYFNKR
jgi:penicillin-binding protein 2